MKRNTVKISIISVAALLVVLLLLINFKQGMPQIPPPAAKREISIDVVIEKHKPKDPKPKVLPEPKTSKGPIASSTLSKDKVLNGALPPISANYREHLGFRRYAEAMWARGARFYVLGSSKKQIYEINFSAKSLRPVSTTDIISRNFSNRTRIIEDEPVLQFFCDKAGKDYQIAAPRIILLIPQQMEQKIASRLSARGIDVSKFSGFRGVYLISAGNFALRINEGVSESGSQSMNVEIPL